MPSAACATASSATRASTTCATTSARASSGRPSRPTGKVVLLIDEIDKADIEFPNDLLQELDRMEFHVYETGETMKARHRPVVIITSNNEKELPDAFLRRCFFHYIRFPDMETMRRIVEVHFPGIKDQLLTTALTQFYELRETPGLKKKPSTSEVLDWLKLLLAEDLTPEDLRRDAEERAAEAARRASEERTGRPAVRAPGLHGAQAHGWRIENVCYLQDLYADAEVRGTGRRPRADRGGLCRRRRARAARRSTG
jgi:MoxR-like ATPase